MHFCTRAVDVPFSGGGGEEENWLNLYFFKPFLTPDFLQISKNIKFNISSSVFLLCHQTEAFAVHRGPTVLLYLYDFLKELLE